jgi:hypothetical protein
VGEVVRRRARVYGRGAHAVYEHSELARAPHTNGPRDVPRRGAQSSLQKPPHTRGESEELGLNFFLKVIFGSVFARAYRKYLIQTRETLTNRNSIVSKS